MNEFGRSVRLQLVYGTEIAKEIRWCFIRCPEHADEIYQEILNNLYQRQEKKNATKRK